MCQKIIQQPDPLLAQGRECALGAMHQIVAQGVDAIAVKLDVELLLQPVKLLPHLLGGEL
ncbi:hypothetical protein D3C76_1580740 [compost metagenome]